MAVPEIPLYSLDVKEFVPDKSEVYKKIGDKELEIHIFNPKDHKTGDKKPCIVFFFGGGWNRGAPSQFYPHCSYLASRGMVAMTANYRVKSRDNTTPKECVKDGKSAIRWIRANAESLGIDENKLIAGGGSAGGHVAAATATTKEFENEGDDKKISHKPNALVLYNPVYDNGPTGFAHSRVKEYWEKISPMHNLSKNTPPTIVLLGTKDNLIPVETAEKYKAIMEKNKTRCDLKLYKDQPHGFFNFRGDKNPYYQKTVIDMDIFLTSLGYLKGKPTIKEK